MGEDTALVVVDVSESAGETLGVLDDAVEALGAGVGDVELDEHLDVRPPGLDGCGEPGDLGDLDAGAGVVEPPEPVPDLVGVTFGQQLA